MSALDLFLSEVKAYDYKWFDEIGGNDVLQEIGTLRSDLEDAKARAKTAEENWHKNEARVSKLHESIKAAQIELHATQRNWDEECLFECNDILTDALKGAE